MAQDDPVRIIPHSPSGIPDTGSFEVVWPDGHEFFYWDDAANRRLRPDAMTHDQALEKARTLAREKRAAIEHACLLCEGTGWVCEAHPDQPFTGPHSCSCGAAGMPCPHCNASSEDELPRLPRGFEPEA